MKYQIPQHINKNKIFIVSRSKIEERLDPKMSLYNQSIRHSIYPKVKLKFLLKENPQYGANEPGIPRIKNESPRYIRITDIDENGLIYENELGVTATKVEDKYILNENDILFARSGATVGKTYIHRKSPYICFFAGYLIRFVINSDKVMPYYVFIYTQLTPYKEWVNAIQRPSGQPNINAEEYQSLEIPIPNFKTQSIIVEKIKNAYWLKSQKELESQMILDSIDFYLLNELFISIKETGNDLKSRKFIINRSNLEGRLDPSVYKDEVKLISDKYENVKLSNYASINPNTSFRRENADTPISFIPMDVIDERYSEVISMSQKRITDSLGFTRFKEGDLLWAKITPCMQNGKSAIARNLINGLGCGSTEFFVIRPQTNQLSTEYLQALLHMKAVRKTAMLYFGGSAGQQRVSVSFLENFNIPLPPLVKQNEIAHHVIGLRQKAKALQKEGKDILEQAKFEVESMIIGK